MPRQQGTRLDAAKWGKRRSKVGGTCGKQLAAGCQGWCVCVGSHSYLLAGPEMWAQSGKLQGHYNEPGGKQLCLHWERRALGLGRGLEL